MVIECFKFLGPELPEQYNIGCGQYNISLDGGHPDHIWEVICVLTGAVWLEGGLSVIHHKVSLDVITSVLPSWQWNVYFTLYDTDWERCTKSRRLQLIL